MTQEPQSNPPENEAEAVEAESYINKVVYFPAGQHVWRQQGPYVVCRECELHHAVFVGVDKIMVGEEDGKPVLRDRSSL